MRYRSPGRGRRTDAIRLVRLWERIRHLETVPRIDELAEEFAVHRATIFQDLRTLREMGERVPVSWYREGL